MDRFKIISQIGLSHDQCKLVAKSATFGNKIRPHGIKTVTFGDKFTLILTAK
jgi:hypothetical protein